MVPRDVMSHIVDGLLMGTTVLAMVVLVLNHVAMPGIVMAIAVLILAVLAVVILTLMWRISRQTKDGK